MSQTIRTLAQLLLEQPDNLARLIRAQDVRDLTVSAMPAQLPRDPTINDDSINSSGAGFFDTSNSWINTVARSLWVCMAGPPHAATWKQVYPPILPPPPPGWFYARLNTSFMVSTNLTRTAIPGTTAPGSSEITLTNHSDTLNCALGEIVLIEGGALPGGTIVGVDLASDRIDVGTVYGLSSAVLLDISPVVYGFDEFAVQTISGQLTILAGGRSGDGTTNPACNIDLFELPNPGDLVLMRLRGTFMSQTVYEFRRWETAIHISLAMPPEFGVSGSPAGANGNLGVTKVNQNALEVWMGPTSGGPAPPTFKPLPVAAIPTLPVSKIDPSTGPFVIALIPMIPVSLLTGPGTINPLLLPPSGGLVQLANTVTSSAGVGTTIFSISNPKGVLCLITFKNTGTQLCNINVQASDMWGNTGVGVTNVIAALGAGGISSWGSFQAVTIGGIWAPFSAITVTVSFFGGASATTVDGLASVVT
jgi:hypothetical protein